MAAAPRLRPRAWARPRAVSRYGRRGLCTRQPGHEHAAGDVSGTHRAGAHVRSRRFRSRSFHGAGMTDLALMTMAEASRLIRARKLSPVELTAALLARITALDGLYHAYIAVMAETALAQAKAAEAEIMAGTWRGLLHGVPYALKDIFDAAGTATTCHSKLHMHHCAVGPLTRTVEDNAMLLGAIAGHDSADPSSTTP